MFYFQTVQTEYIMNTKKIIYFLVTAFACVSCLETKTDYVPELSFGEQKCIAELKNTEILTPDSSFTYDANTLSIKIVDTLIITESRNSATGGWRIMNLQWKEIGAFLDRGHAKGEFGSIPAVHNSPFFYENDTLYSIAHDNRLGSVYKINMTKTIEDSCLNYTLLHRKLKKPIDRFVYINDKDYLIRENTFKKNVLKKWTLFQNGKAVKNDILDEINKINIASEDWNVLAAFPAYNRKHATLIQVYKFFNTINIIQVHKNKCITVSYGKHVDLETILQSKKDNVFHEETQLYDDVFAVMDSKDKNRPRIHVYDYEGNPIKEYVLAKPATAFDFDKINGYLYTHDYENGLVVRYKATL